MGIRGVTYLNVFALPLVVSLLTGCTSYGEPDIRAEPSISCDDVLQSVLGPVRADDTAGADGAQIDWLGQHCSSQYDVFVDYISTKTMAETLGPDTCASLQERLGRPAIDLLSADGHCVNDGTQATAEAPELVQQPGGGIAWNEAAAHAGTTQRVCGPLAGGGNSYDDVFLNLGRDYPDPARFQIVVWDIGSLEPIAGGLTLCTSGRITLYEGVAQIELYDPSSIEIYE